MFVTEMVLLLMNPYQTPPSLGNASSHYSRVIRHQVMLFWLIYNSDEVEITMGSIFVIGKKQKKDRKH